MKLELSIALRYLFARRKHAFISVISVMSLLGVGLGVAALVIVLGVYNGFSTDIRSKLLAANAQVMVTGLSYASNRSIANDPDVAVRMITEVKDVVSVAPFIYSEGMISSPRGVKGIVIRGVDPETAPKTISVLRKLFLGSISDMDGKGLPGIVLGKELARHLSLHTGSVVNLLSPSGQSATHGYQPKIKQFKVTGIFQSGLFEYDTSVGYISLRAARELTGMKDNFVSGIELGVKNPDKADLVALDVKEKLGANVTVRHWMEMNTNLFAALRLEKLGMFVILIMVVLIGSFSIVTTLVMMVMEKTRDIALLMSLGLSKSRVKHIFMWMGTIIGSIGILLGYVLGIGLGLALQKYQFIKLPNGVYTVDHLPVLMLVSDNLFIGACAFCLCFVATIYPASKAAALEPAIALRYE